jgi:N-acetylmuramoyl-L-alanine amidase
MKILIDNGHGFETPGKCSPDGRHKEWAWAREVAQMIIEELQQRGYDARRIVTENQDIRIQERCQRVNTICKEAGAKNVLLVSVHNNAAGSDGEWHNASGFSAFVSLNASKGSKDLARCIISRALRTGLKGNRSVPKEGYWKQNLGICRDTNCPAVLTENLFQDNEGDVTYLQSEIGKRTLAQVHVDGIIDYIKGIGQ